MYIPPLTHIEHLHATLDSCMYGMPILEYVRTNMYAYMNTYIRSSILTCRLYMYEYVHAYTHACIHTYICYNYAYNHL
jgi:hypothetical protein